MGVKRKLVYVFTLTRWDVPPGVECRARPVPACKGLLMNMSTINKHSHGCSRRLQLDLNPEIIMFSGFISNSTCLGHPWECLFIVHMFININFKLMVGFLMVCVCVCVCVSACFRKKMFYLTTHSTHLIYGYMASDIWLRTILIVRKETRCHHIGYSFRLTARVLLYAPSHRKDSTYHGLCYTSRGALAGTRNSSMGQPHEGSIRRPIAP